MKAGRRRNRGIVMFIALMILALVAAGIAALTEAGSDDGLRTFHQSQQAQLEQLLLAGAADALVRLRTTAPALGTSWKVELPPSLAEHGATLETNVTSIPRDGQIELLIKARLDKHAASQQLVRFERGASGWRLISAKLDHG